jgi:hypothetical protein
LPKIIFRIDDLPAPEGPESTTHSPNRREARRRAPQQFHPTLQMMMGLLGVADFDHRIHWR